MMARPTGTLISLPLQNNGNFNTGPRNGTQDVLNIPPVIPNELNGDCNVTTPTMMRC